MAIGGMEIVYFSLLQLKHGSIGYSHGCTDVRGSYFTVRATTMGRLNYGGTEDVLWQRPERPRARLWFNTGVG